MRKPRKGMVERFLRHLILSRDFHTSLMLYMLSLGSAGGGRTKGGMRSRAPWECWLNNRASTDCGGNIFRTMRPCMTWLSPNNITMILWQTCSGSLFNLLLFYISKIWNRPENWPNRASVMIRYQSSWGQFMLSTWLTEDMKTFITLIHTNLICLCFYPTPPTLSKHR